MPAETQYCPSCGAHRVLTGAGASYTTAIGVRRRENTLLAVVNSLMYFAWFNWAINIVAGAALAVGGWVAVKTGSIVLGIIVGVLLFVYAWVKL